MNAVTLPVSRVREGVHDQELTLSSNTLNSGLSEGCRYQIGKPGAGWALTIDDEDLADSGEAWCWSPGYYAGCVRAELFRPDGSLAAVFGIDVSPSQTKLGREMFQDMLDELWAFDPMLVLGTEPSLTRIGVSGELRSPWLEYVRLRQHGEAFVRSLKEITRRPIRELRAYRRDLPAHQVRRADHVTLSRALKDPACIGLLAHRTEAPALTGVGTTFDVPAAREDLDGAANRCELAVLRAVLWRAIRLRRELEILVRNEAESETRTELRRRWPRRDQFLSSLIRSLKRLQGVKPFFAVKRPEFSAAGLNAISADPAYSAAYRHGWRILRGGIEGPPDAEALWISPTWEIYERWAFTKVLGLIKEHWPGTEFRKRAPQGTTATYALSGETEGGETISVLLQPRFGAWDQSDGRLARSVSGAREPDIVISVQAGATTKCLVLDAKYRTSRRNVLDSMASAHLYRDSLRYAGRNVCGAVLLIPKGGGAAWLEDAAFIETHRVGVVELAEDLSHLRLLMERWLDGGY